MALAALVGLGAAIYLSCAVSDRTRKLPVVDLLAGLYEAVKERMKKTPSPSPAVSSSGCVLPGPPHLRPDGVLLTGAPVEYGPAEQLFAHPEREETKDFLSGSFG